MGLWIVNHMDISDHPIPAPADLRRDGRHRRYRAPLSIKHVQFKGDTLPLARRIEAKAQLERVCINTMLLRLLRRGLEAEAQPEANP